LGRVLHSFIDEETEREGDCLAEVRYQERTKDITGSKEDLRGSEITRKAVII